MDILKMMYIIEGYKLSQERNLALVEEFLSHIADENDYLRKKGEKLLEDIRSGLTKVGDKGAGESGMVRGKADPDEPEWHPGPLDTP
jgi:hypothetical protein